jgi:hypothetical protein
MFDQAPGGERHDFVGHSRVRQARGPGQLVVSIMRRPAMPAVGNHMITEAFRRRRETCRALRRATLRDRNVSSSRMLEQRPGGDGVFGMSSMTAKRSSENAWTPSAAASAPAMHGLHAFLAVDAEADQGGRSCRPAPIPSGWLAAPGGIVVGRSPVILAGSTAGTKMAGSAGAGTSKTRRWRSRVTGLAPTGRRAIASIARGIMVRWPLVLAGYVVDLIPSG